MWCHSNTVAWGSSTDGASWQSGVSRLATALKVMLANTPLQLHQSIGRTKMSVLKPDDDFRDGGAFSIRATDSEELIVHSHDSMCVL